MSVNRCTVEALVHSIPVIQSISVGQTFTTDRARGFTHVLVVRLKDRDSLPVYAKHPGAFGPFARVSSAVDLWTHDLCDSAHVSVVETHIKPILDEIMAVDIEAPRVEPSWPGRALVAVGAVAIFAAGWLAARSRSS